MFPSGPQAHTRVDSESHPCQAHKHPHHGLCTQELLGRANVDKWCWWVRWGLCELRAPRAEELEVHVVQAREEFESESRELQCE